MMYKWKLFTACAATAAVFGATCAGVVGTSMIASYYNPTSAEAPVLKETSASVNTGEKTLTSDSTGENASAGTKETAANETSLGSAEPVSNTNLSIQEIASEAMPSMVAITNTSVQQIEDYFGNYGYGGYGFGGGIFGSSYESTSDNFEGSIGGSGSLFGDDFENEFGGESEDEFGGDYGYGGFGDGQTIESVSMGTGVIIGETDDTILIATNAHVVSDANQLSVAFVDDTAAEAVTVGSDDQNDLAVISVKKADLSEETLSAIKVISLGSSDELIVGESVVAIGNALGYGQSVSSGIVSALNRSIVTEDEFSGASAETAGMIQTDASINPGNSGGALLNMKGQLIGINSAKYADTSVEGMGYAIPIDYALPILTSLAKGETPSAKTEENGEPREYSNENTVRLGISCASVTEEYAEYYGVPTGVYVDSVEPGSAAEAAGIVSGDIIEAIDGTAVKSVDELSAALAKYKEGDSAEITVAREGKRNNYQEGTLTVTFKSGNTQAA